MDLPLPPHAALSSWSSVNVLSPVCSVELNHTHAVQAAPRRPPHTSRDPNPYWLGCRDPSNALRQPPTEVRTCLLDANHTTRRSSASRDPNTNGCTHPAAVGDGFRRRSTWSRKPPLPQHTSAEPPQQERSVVQVFLAVTAVPQECALGWNTTVQRRLHHGRRAPPPIHQPHRSHASRAFALASFMCSTSLRACALFEDERENSFGATKTRATSFGAIEILDYTFSAIPSHFSSTSY